MNSISPIDVEFHEFIDSAMRFISYCTGHGIHIRQDMNNMYRWQAVSGHNGLIHTILHHNGAHYQHTYPTNHTLATAPAMAQPTMSSHPNFSMGVAGYNTVAAPAMAQPTMSSQSNFSTGVANYNTVAAHAMAQPTMFSQSNFSMGGVPSAPQPVQPVPSTVQQQQSASVFNVQQVNRKRKLSDSESDDETQIISDDSDASLFNFAEYRKRAQTPKKKKI